MSSTREVRLCPSILNADHSHLAQEIERVAPYSDLLHLDIMDNIFVPNQTFSLEQSRSIVASSSIPVDAHLMVIDPDRQGPAYADLGCASVTFHFEASTNPAQTISLIRASGTRVGLAIKPGTPYFEVERFLPDIDMLLVMTVEPGFGGQSFMPEMMEKVESARRAIDLMPGEKPWIQVDGGISPATIARAALSGADTFVAGSAVFKAPDAKAVLLELRQLASAPR
jgi:ribulose-phosphate 3-epimerase